MILNILVSLFTSIYEVGSSADTHCLKNTISAGVFASQSMSESKVIGLEEKLYPQIQNYQDVRLVSPDCLRYTKHNYYGHLEIIITNENINLQMILREVIKIFLNSNFY